MQYPEKKPKPGPQQKPDTTGCWRAGPAYDLSALRTVKVVPSPTVLATAKWPSALLTMRCTGYRPTPPTSGC